MIANKTTTNTFDPRKPGQRVAVDATFVQDQVHAIEAPRTFDVPAVTTATTSSPKQSKRPDYQKATVRELIGEFINSLFHQGKS